MWYPTKSTDRGDHGSGRWAANRATVQVGQQAPNAGMYFGGWSRAAIANHADQLFRCESSEPFRQIRRLISVRGTVQGGQGTEQC